MNKLFLFLAFFCLLFSCKEDEELLNLSMKEDLLKGPIYFSLNISYLEPTRASTTSSDEDSYVSSSDGEVASSQQEAKINSLLIVITKEGEKSVALKKMCYKDELEENKLTFYFLENEIEDLKNQNLNLYVLCNPNEDIISDDFSLDAIYKMDEMGEPWEDGNMLMSNAQAFTFSLPKDLSQYRKLSEPFSLGTLYVEHSFAKINLSFNKGRLFSLTAYDETKHKNVDTQVILDKLALINLSNEFYLFKRVAPSKSNSFEADLSSTKILGTETSNNWVIDVDASEKLSFSGNSISSNFNSHLCDPSSWQWIDLSSLQEKETSSIDLGYLPENTLPSIDSQKLGALTGIVFHAMITCEDFPEVFGSLGDSPIMIYNNIIYTGSRAMMDAGENLNDDRLYSIGKTIYDYETSSSYHDIKNVEGILLLESLGVSWVWTTDNYSSDCYYYYFIEHNKDEDEENSPMEFAVVRNNQYSLSLEDISGYGHLYQGEYTYNSDKSSLYSDPNPIDPDKLVKTLNSYSKVNFSSLSWTR